MGIVHKNTDYCGSETDFPRRNFYVYGEKKSAVQKRKKKKKGSTSFSSALNTRETYGACSHVAVAHLGRIIVNTVTCCYSRGLATGLNAVILTCLCAMFQLRKSKCYKSSQGKFSRVGWGVVGVGGGGGARFQSFSFKSVPMPEIKMF